MKAIKLSPKKYILTKARNLPFGECLINDDWQEKGMAVIFINKIMPSGKKITGLYMVDTFCLGVKNTFYKFGINDYQHEQLMNEASQAHNMIPIDVSEAHNIIYGSIDFAEELGFKPHDDFKLTEYILDPAYIDDGIDDIEFGKDGKPFFIAGPNDNVERIMSILSKNADEVGFDYITPEF